MRTANAQAQTNLRIQAVPLTQYRELEEASDKQPEILPRWMTAHARLTANNLFS